MLNSNYTEKLLGLQKEMVKKEFDVSVPAVIRFFMNVQYAKPTKKQKNRHIAVFLLSDPKA